MSLILEALRKSEAERRRAQAPDLFAEPAPLTRQAMASSPRWLGWALAALTALLLTGWFARAQWIAPLQRAAAQPAPTLADATPPARDPNNAGVRPDADAAPRETIGSAPASIATATTAAVAPPVRGPSALTPLEPKPAAPADSAAAPDRTAAAPMSAPIRAPLSAPLPPPAAASNAPLQLADLGSEERLQLPTLKMSMHLWDAASTQRFVILDGERRVEGDRIGNAVVEEITPDGVVLAWQGRHLKLPIR